MLPRPLRIYVDQLHLGPQADAAIARLTPHVERDEVRVPISLTHVLETAKDMPSRRESVRARLLALSRGEVLAGELAVLRLEASAARRSLPHGWIRDRVVTTNVWEWVIAPTSPLWLRAAHRWFPLPPERLFAWMRLVPDDRRVGDVVTDALRRGADRANAARPRWQDALRGAIGKELIRDLDDEGMRTTFRAVDCRRVLQEEIGRARPAGLEGNDLPDIAFLCVALPYLDAVCVDRPMYARIEDARKRSPVRWAKAFRRMDKLLDWLDETCATERRVT